MRAAAGAKVPAYAALVANLRGRARIALAMAPLVSVLGMINACGGAPPVDPRVEVDDGGTPETGGDAAITASDTGPSDDAAP